MEITYEGFPYTFRGVKGRAVVTPGRVVLEQFTAFDGLMRAGLSGEIIIGETTDSAELRLEAKNLPIDARLIAAMPKELTPLAGRFRPGGSLDVELKSFRFTRSFAPASQPASRAGTRTASQPASAVSPVRTWSVEGSAFLKDAVVDIGLVNKKFSGVVFGSVARTQNGLKLEADIQLDRMRIGKQTITDFRGRLRKSERSRLVRVEDISARSHGGRLAGFAEIKLTDPLQFGVSMSVENIDLNRLFNAGIIEPEKRSNVKGLLMGNLQLTGMVGRPETRQASGVLRISKARLYKLPVVLGLLHVLYLSLPSKTAFTEGEMAYYLRGGKLVFREIHLTGPALSLVGSGSMDMKTEKLNLTFLTGPPGKLPRMRGLADGLLESIIREIVEIQVTGTLTKPRTRTVTLRSLDDVIRRLLRPGRTGE